MDEVHESSEIRRGLQSSKTGSLHRTQTGQQALGTGAGWMVNYNRMTDECGRPFTLSVLAGASFCLG